VSNEDDVVEKRDVVDEIEDELTEQLVKEERKTRKKRVVEVDPEEEAVDDLVQEMKDNEIKRYGRGPGVPPSRDRRRRDVIAKSQGRSRIQWNVPNVDEIQPKNPRNSKTHDSAIEGRRRERIWRARERCGLGCRRPIIDKDGNDTGATTSSQG